MPGSLSLTRQGALIGRIVTYLGDTPFPHDNWNDFLIVLAHWLRAAAKMSAAATEQVRFGFMEGPYQIDAIRKQ